MRSNPYPIVIVGLALFMYLAYHKFDVTCFFTEETDKTKAVVTSTSWTDGPRGWGAYQLVMYEYQVGDSTYQKSYKAGRSDGLRSVGDSILVEYSITDPGKNKRLRYYSIIH